MAIDTHYEPAGSSMTGDTAFLRGPMKGDLGGYAGLSAAEKTTWESAYTTYSSFAPRKRRQTPLASGVQES